MALLLQQSCNEWLKPRTLIEMLRNKFDDQRGFTLPEILVVILIIMISFVYALPAYKVFATRGDLKQIATIVKTEIRNSHNNAINGKVPTSGVTTNWVFHLHTIQTGTTNHFAVAGCSPVNHIFTSALCNVGVNANYKETSLLPKFKIYPVAISPEVADKYDTISEVNIFFSPISGVIKVYDQSGNLIGLTVNIKIQSDEYPNIYYLLTVNNNGTISEQTM